MTAVKDRKNGTITLKDCGASEVLTVLLGLSDGSPEVVELLHQILANQANEKEHQQMFEDDLIAKIAEQKTVADSVKTLLENLTAVIKANPNPDPVKQAEILAALTGNTQELADAVVANTPSAPVA